MIARVLHQFIMLSLFWSPEESPKKETDKQKVAVMMHFDSQLLLRKRRKEEVDKEGEEKEINFINSGPNSKQTLK